MTMKRSMMIFLMVVLATLFFMGDIQAQTQTGGGNTGGGGSATSGPKEDLDLPVDKPEFVEEEEEDEEDKPDEEEPPNLYDEDLPATESITYVVDCSGSMGWGSTSWTGPDGSSRSGTPLDRAKFELVKSINALSKNFEFNCIEYDCSNSSLWGSHKEANDKNKSKARGWVMSLRARGATGTGGACAKGLKNEKDSLVLLTDGSPNCNPSGGTSTHKSFILGNNPNKAKISCIGIGDYGSFQRFLKELAGQTGGSYIHVD